MTNLIEIKRKTNVLYVYWTLTDFCNFRCSYCPAELHSGFYHNKIFAGFPTDDEIRVFLDRLINIHAKDHFLVVTLSGGEPTLHPMYKEIVDALHPHGIVVTVSNGTRSVEWWQELNHLPDIMVISLHPEWTKISKINELGEFLLDNNVELSFNLMSDNSRWDRVQEMYQQLIPRLQNIVNAKILTEQSGSMLDGTHREYTNDQLEYIKNLYATEKQLRHRFNDIDIGAEMKYSNGTTKHLTNPFDLINSYQHGFKGWECNAGVTDISITYEGFVYSGACRVKRLGRIDKFELLAQPITCPKQWCMCIGDLSISKKKPTLHQDQ
jgi:MoaA/NifB/PqqE/SkfB family radical SAM enzyme